MEQPVKTNNGAEVLHPEDLVKLQALPHKVKVPKKLRNRDRRSCEAT